MREQKYLIGGEWRSGETAVEIRDIFSGRQIARVYQAGIQEAEEAVTAAQKACSVTAAYSGFERAALLHSIAAAVQQRKEEFARCITAEAGKPITASRTEVDRAVITFTTAAEEATRMSGEVIPLDISPAAKGRRGIVQRFPSGIILCITPFNFPLNLVAHKIAPAIASGNAFILKPAPQTPLTALLLGEVMLASGLEKRTINIVPAPNAVTEIMVRDDRIAMVSFTGSARVGWTVKTNAGKKKTALELGGNAAVIVHKDADIPLAVSRCVVGAFGYAGQVCIKVQRILVQESIFEKFKEEFISSTASVISGDPGDEQTVVGPMISEAEAQRVESWVQEAIHAGAVLLTGGTRNGRFYSPTVVTHVTPAMKVCSEEIFGPVVTLEPFAGMSEAVNSVNGSRYGLQAGIFTNDHAAIEFAYRELKVGGLIVNDYPTFRVDTMPYGGIKDSGFGREGVRYAMQEMTDLKLLVL